MPSCGARVLLPRSEALLCVRYVVCVSNVGVGFNRGGLGLIRFRITIGIRIRPDFHGNVLEGWPVEF